MGNLINPIGGRLNTVNFWHTTWPVAYHPARQSLFFQLSLHLKFLSNLILRRVFMQNPSHTRKGVLHGLLLNFIANVWGFYHQNLSLYLTFYDYKITVRLLRVKKKKFLWQRMLFNLKKFCFLRSWFKGKPGGLFDSQQVVLRHLARQNIFFRRHRRSRSFQRRLRRYLRRGLRAIRRILKRRVGAWHRNLIVHVKPYLTFLCRSFKFTKCFFFTRLIKSSVTAGMVVRYMILKLGQGFGLKFVVRTTKRTLRKFFKEYAGYKLCLAGRFTRKQIASYTWFKIGSITLNQRMSGIDYVQDFGFSKFGLFGIKLWIFKHVNQSNLR